MTADQPSQESPQDEIDRIKHLQHNRCIAIRWLLIAWFTEAMGLIASRAFTVQFIHRPAGVSGAISWYVKPLALLCGATLVALFFVWSEYASVRADTQDEPKQTGAPWWSFVTPPVLLLFLNWKVPQIGDMLLPGWARGTNRWLYYAAWVEAVAEWLIFMWLLTMFDRALVAINNSKDDVGLKGELISIVPHRLRSTGQDKPGTLVNRAVGYVDRQSSNLFARVLRLPRKARIRVLLPLVAGSFGLSVLLFSFAEELLCMTPERFPALTLSLLLRMCVYTGTILSVLHQSITYRRFLLAIISVLPILLLYVGMFTVAPATYILVGIIMYAIVMAPIVRALQLFEAKTLWRVLTITLGLLLIVYSAWTWNYYDADRFAPQEDISATTPGGSKSAPFLPATAHDVEQSLPPALPPVFLDLGGGGSRAAVFSAGVIRDLWFTPVSMAGLKPPDQKAVASLTPDEFDLITEPNNPKEIFPGRLMLLGTRFISSVSGGSLASAYWTNGTYRQLAAQQGMENVPALKRRELALKSFFAADGSALNSRYVDMMSQNYLASVVVGLFSLSLSRSEQIRQTFDHFALTYDTSLAPDDTGKTVSCSDKLTISKLKDDEVAGLLPYSIFNATITTTGERLAATNLPCELFRGVPWMSAQLDYRVVPPPDAPRFPVRPGQIVTHYQIDGNWDPLLRTAIWMSSDFPYGFAVNRMPYSESGRPDTLIASTDGGLSDNLGVNSTMALIRGFIYRAYATPSMTNLQTAHPGRFFVMDVDTSELPIDPGTPGSLWYHLAEPGNAALRTKRVNEQTLWALYKTELESGQASSPDTGMEYASATTSGSIPDPILCGFHSKNNSWAWYRVECGVNAGDHVYTSWHLSDSELEKIKLIRTTDPYLKTIKAASLRYLRMVVSAPKG